MKKGLIILISLLTAQSVAAEGPIDFHVSGQAVMARIKASGESFSPTLFHFKADAQVSDGFFDGVGIQGLIGVPISDDKKRNLTVDVKQQSAAYLTFTSPNLEPDDLKFVLYVGYASTELESHLSTIDLKVKDKYNGTSYGFSLQQRMSARHPVYLTIDCARYYRSTDLRIDGCGLGATYAF